MRPRENDDFIIITMLIDRKLLTRLKALQIPSRQRMRQQHRGEKTSLRKGSSLEFSDYREYLQGDDIRRIDWSVYARTERFYLKLFFEEESRPIFILVDGSESMSFGSPPKFEYALSLAAYLSYISLCHYDRPQLLVLKNKEFQNYRFGSMKLFFPILNLLKDQQPIGETYLNAILKKLAGKSSRAGICFLLSDFFSPDGFEGIKLLSAIGYEIHCLQILSQEEIKPDFRGDLRLVDSETKSSAEVSISPHTLRNYLTRLHDFQSAIQKTATQSFASFTKVSTSTPIETLMLQDMRRQKILI
jgi:uncharacterized protein (DUF58 family)